MANMANYFSSLLRGRADNTETCTTTITDNQNTARVLHEPIQTQVENNAFDAIREERHAQREGAIVNQARGDYNVQFDRTVLTPLDGITAEADYATDRVRRRIRDNERDRIRRVEHGIDNIRVNIVHEALTNSFTEPTERNIGPNPYSSFYEALMRDRVRHFVLTGLGTLRHTNGVQKEIIIKRCLFEAKQDLFNRIFECINKCYYSLKSMSLEQIRKNRVNISNGIWQSANLVASAKATSIIADTNYVIGDFIDELVKAQAQFLPNGREPLSKEFLLTTFGEIRLNFIVWKNDKGGIEYGYNRAY